MSQIKQVDKIRLFALVEPVNVRLCLCFPVTSLVCKKFYYWSNFKIKPKYTILLMKQWKNSE